MNLRLFYVMVIGFFALLLVDSACGRMAVADDGQQIMTPASGESVGAVNNLRLKMYEAAAGDLSLCDGDESCLKNAKVIQSWVCADNACGGKGTSKEPTTCFNGLFDKYSINAQEQIAALICPVIKDPGAATRRALLTRIPNASESDLVESVAYFLALKKSAVSCENYIKNYVGAYGPQWSYDWYKALSGCRILGRETSPEQEEKDFYVWFEAAQGSGNCSGIVNSEMRNACNAPGAASPLSVYGQ